MVAITIIFKMYRKKRNRTQRFNCLTFHKIKHNFLERKEWEEKENTNTVKKAAYYHRIKGVLKIISEIVQ